jgi:PAS domain S-box-containing protein
LVAVADIKQTGAFDRLGNARPLDSDSPATARVLLQALPIAGALLDRGGIVRHANRAWAELLRADVPNIEGEPALGWIRRAGEREAFGREFLQLRDREAGAAFTRELDLNRAFGPPARSRVRVAKLGRNQLLITATRADTSDAETELGRAVSRALDALDQGVFLVDGEGRIVHVNPATQRLLGEGAAGPVGRMFVDLVAHGQVEAVERGLKLARAGSWHGEVDLVRPDGDVVPTELTLAGGSGEGAPVVVQCRDLRAHRQRQWVEELTRQVDRALVSSSEPRDALMAAVSALSTGLGALRAVVVTVVGGRWVRWSVRPDASPTFDKLDDATHPPSEWQRGDDLVEMGEVDDAHARVFGPDRAHARAVRVVLRAPGGVVGYLLATHDPRPGWTRVEAGLLSQLAPQLALALANGLLMLETRALAGYQGRVLDQTAVLINSVDEEGKVVTWNRASEQLLGIRSEDAIGKVFGIDVARAADAGAWSELWADLFARGVATRELVVLDQEGDERPLHLDARVLRDGSEVRGAVLVGLDLRTRRALETQVARSQKMAAVGLLAAGIAHEINNPLSGVVGYSALLLERELDPEIRRMVQHISSSAERCRKIVEGVLLFSRQRSGARERVELSDLIARMVRIGEYQWKMHNCRIVREVSDSVEVMADLDQLEQVLLNLLSNAVDAMPNGGTVRIALSATETGARIDIQDDGPGIPDEIRENVFDPFFSTKSIGKGTGLGLSISYGIVRDHGGDILLESRPGRGAHFVILLPKDGLPSAENRPRES